MTYGGFSNPKPDNLPPSEPAIIVGALYRLRYRWQYDSQVQTVTARAIGPGRGSGIAWQPEPAWQQGALPGPVEILSVVRL